MPVITATGRLRWEDQDPRTALGIKGDRYQWLMPVVLATRGIEMRRIMVQGQARQIVQETLSPK
jgi:hypothetical protein